MAENLPEKRLLSETEAGFYLGLKKSKTREFCAEHGCIVRIGRRVLYDKDRIDKVIDELRVSIN